MTVARLVVRAQLEWTGSKRPWFRYRCSSPLTAAYCRFLSTEPQRTTDGGLPCQDPNLARDSYLHINNTKYPIDSWTNVPSSILAALPRRLHLEPSHPVSLTRQLIESQFPPPIYTHYNTLPPVVTVAQNFDSLGFSPDLEEAERTPTTSTRTRFSELTAAPTRQIYFARMKAMATQSVQMSIGGMPSTEVIIRFSTKWKGRGCGVGGECSGMTSPWQCGATWSKCQTMG